MQGVFVLGSFCLKISYTQLGSRISQAFEGLIRVHD